MHVWQLCFYLFFYHVCQIKIITSGRNNYCIYTLRHPLNLPQVMKIYGSSGYFYFFIFFFTASPLHPPPHRWSRQHLSLAAHPSPKDSLHPTTLLSSPFGVAHLYGNNWSASPPALFKARFHHPPLSFFWCFFINLQTTPLHHPTGLKMCEVRQRVRE